MSKQLTVSAAFSVFLMVSYVLFGGAAVRLPMSGVSAGEATFPVELSAPAMARAGTLLPALR